MRLLLRVLIACAIASGVAGANPFSGVTVSCSAGVPSAVVGCFVERPVVLLGPLVVAVGVDAEVRFSEPSSEHLAPYLLVAYDAERFGLWAQLIWPRLEQVPVIGSPDVLKLGFSYSIP